MDDPRAATSYVAGFDGTPSGRGAVALALTLARRTGARVVAAHVHAREPAWPLPTAARAAERDWLADARRRADELAARLADELGEEGETVVVEATSPAHGLHELAEDTGAALLVVGSTGRGPIGRVLAGSTARKLLHGAPCPVLVAPVRPAPHPAPRRVVAGFDGTPEAHEAMRVAGRLAEDLEAELHAVAVDVPIAITAPVAAASAQHAGWMDERLEHQLATARQDVPPGVALRTHVLAGPVGPVLAEAVGADDVLVVGSRGYGPVRAVLAGTVAGFLVDHAPCPVLVVPRGSA